MTKDGLTLNPAVRHPDAAFGFGRRICPGQVMAQSSIWLVIASMLYCFDIVKPKGDDGAPIEPAGTYSSGLIWCVLGYEIYILLTDSHAVTQTLSSASSNRGHLK
jgi:hypothetical protein